MDIEKDEYLKIINLGVFTDLQGNDYSYRNILQSNGKYIVLKIEDPNFTFDKLGSTTFCYKFGTILLGSRCQSTLSLFWSADTLSHHFSMFCSRFQYLALFSIRTKRQFMYF